jgi:SAM-dependent MidA family methyltransferase
LSPEPLHDRIVSIIRRRGPISVASFMELALYDPQQGYYASEAQRSGRRGDFYTSVDVSPLFGGLIAEQLAEMWHLLRAGGAENFDLVEAGAGNGRLSRDILDAVAAHHPEFYRRLRVTLVERSAAARAAQRDVLGPHAGRLLPSATDLPQAIHGVIVANELLDALPVHVLEMTAEGLREVVVGERDGGLVEGLARVSDPRLTSDLPPLEPGERIEVGSAAIRWIGDAAAALGRGFVLLFDYVYETSSVNRTHPRGTLMSYRAHRGDGESWLANPGERDLTAHVNLTALRRAGEAAGLNTLGAVDQTYFLVALGLAGRLETGHDERAVRERLAARTLILPGGLGDTMKAMVFAKGMGTPALRGLQSGRLT